MLNDRALDLPLKVEIVIGRADEEIGWKPDVDLSLYGGTANAGISRRHARLVWFGDWQIEDLNSANGTWLNGRQLAPGSTQPLAPGAVIKIGKLYLIYHD